MSYTVSINIKKNKTAAKSLIPKLANFLILTRQRSDLSQLTPEQICDIGLSRQEINNELNKPIWGTEINSKK